MTDKDNSQTGEYSYTYSYSYSKEGGEKNVEVHTGGSSAAAAGEAAGDSTGKTTAGESSGGKSAASRLSSGQKKSDSAGLCAAVFNRRRKLRYRLTACVTAKLNTYPPMPQRGSRTSKNRTSSSEVNVL